MSTVPERNRGLVLAFAASALLLAVTLLAYRVPPPLGADAPPGEFSAYRALTQLQDLVGDNVPHPIGSAANAAVRARIVEKLKALGYSPTLQTGFACHNRGACGTPTNIVATLGLAASPGDSPPADATSTAAPAPAPTAAPAATLSANAASAATAPASADAVLIAAHYDSVAAGAGASDDGAGVAALLEIARILRTIPTPRHPIVLLVTDGEEAGLLGAELFAREHPLSSRIGAAVNMEARGVSGPSLMFETGSANTWLMHLYAAAIARPNTNSLYYVVYRLLPNDTDFTVFKAAAYQGFNLAFIGDVGHYHTPLDSLANISPGSLQHQGDNALHALLALANAGDLHRAASESVFFDVLARTVVAWPVGWALPAAIVLLVILLLELVLFIRVGLLKGRQLAWGSLAVLVTLILGAALSVASMALLRALGKLPPLNALPWIAHPLPMNIAPASIAVLCAGIAAALMRRAGFWGFWTGTVLFTVLLAVVLGALAPGASFVPLLTGLAAVLAALPAAFSSRSGAPSPGAMEFSALSPGLVLFGASLPLMLLLYPALGALGWPAATLLMCLSGGFLLPLLANATRRARQRLIALSATATLAAILVTLLLPTYSAEWPQRLDVEYWLDAGHRKAHWWVDALSGQLPPALGRAAAFDHERRAPAAGIPWLGFEADAPALDTADLAAPTLIVTASNPGATPGRTHYQLRLESARRAPAATVVFPVGANVGEMLVVTPPGPLPVKLRRLSNGATGFRVSGIPAGGMEFGIDAPPGPVSALVFDETYGLPGELPQGKELERLRPANATSSQDGDITVVVNTVRLNPVAGR